MQIKIFSIPIPGGEAINEEMNKLLRSKKVLQTESELVNTENGTFWCFCIKYLDDVSGTFRKTKVDYREVLDDECFQRFSDMRKIRKALAQKEGIPAYAIFTDEELAGLAKLKTRTTATMKTVPGIGEKKIEKYGDYFSATIPNPVSR